MEYVPGKYRCNTFHEIPLGINPLTRVILAKGQLISKANYQAVNSSKKRTNEFVFTTMRRVFVRFFEEIEVIKKTFRN